MTISIPDLPLDRPYNIVSYFGPPAAKGMWVIAHCPGEHNPFVPFQIDPLGPDGKPESHGYYETFDAALEQVTRLLPFYRVYRVRIYHWKDGLIEESPLFTTGEAADALAYDRLEKAAKDMDSGVQVDWDGIDWPADRDFGTLVLESTDQAFIKEHGREVLKAVISSIEVKHQENDQ